MLEAVNVAALFVKLPLTPIVVVPEAVKFQIEPEFNVTSANDIALLELLTLMVPLMVVAPETVRFLEAVKVPLTVREANVMLEADVMVDPLLICTEPETVHVAVPVIVLLF